MDARSEKLEEFDALARKALKEREYRYEEWKAWKRKPVPPTAAGGWLRSKARNSLASTEKAMIDAYNLAGRRNITIRRLPIPSDPPHIPKTYKSDVL